MNVGELFVRLAMDYSQYDRDERTARSRVTSLGGTLSGIMKNAFSFSLGLGLVQGFRSLSGAVTDFVNTAARTDVLNIAMQSVARSSGYAVDALSEHKQAVMEKGIAEQEATQILTRFMQAQLGTVDAAKLARVAQDAAVIAGYNSSQAAEQMTEAIAKQRPELLSAFGMTRNMNDIYTDYGRTVGKTAAQLTEAQKKQAMLSYILSEGERIAGTYEASMGAVGKQISSLPRFWDTLKNAIARPLALPAVSVVVEGITDALRNGIAWAEANQATLQRWGQSIANAVRMAWRWILGFARSVAAHWSTIGALTRWVVAGFFAFKTVTLIMAGAAAATRLWSRALLAVNGQLAAKAGLLAWVNNLSVYYQVLMYGATASTNVFTAALIRAKAAMQALLVSIPVVGWAILGLTLLLGIGMSSWNRYAASVQQANQKAQMEKMAAQQKAYVESVNQATQGTLGQAKAMEEMGEAAGKNLQSFDEVHSLMDEMADAAAPSLGITAPGAPEMPDLTMDMSGLFGDLTGEVEGAKTTLGGFWQWTWNAFKTWVGDKWTTFRTWAGETWEGITTWVAEKWGALAAWVGPKWDGFTTWIGERWDTFRTWAGEKWAGITGTIAEKWSTMRTRASEIWDGVKTTVLEKWDNISARAGEVWENVRSILAEKWGAARTRASEVWEGVRSTIAQKWNALKTDAPVVWENIKSSLSARWNDLRADAATTWSSIHASISDTWEALQTNAPVVWENIKSNISTRWENLKAAAPVLWEDIKQNITTRFEQAKTNVIAAAQNMRDQAPEAWVTLLARIRERRDDLFSALTRPWDDAKATILGLIDSAKNWGRNLIGNIVDGIRERMASVKDAVSNVASTIKNWLGFSSPTEEGPGRYADRWAPSLMRMYAEGILANIGQVQAAARDVAQSLAPMTVAPNLVLAGVSGGGGRGSTPVVSAPSWAGGPAPEIHLHIGTLVADSHGLRQLERKLREIRYGEDHRTGVTGS